MSDRAKSAASLKQHQSIAQFGGVCKMHDRQAEQGWERLRVLELLVLLLQLALPHQDPYLGSCSFLEDSNSSGMAHLMEVHDAPEVTDGLLPFFDMRGFHGPEATAQDVGHLMKVS